MLPDFPQIKNSILKEINKYLRSASRESPMLSKIRVVHLFEGDSMATQTEDGESEKSPYEEISGKIQIDIGAIIEKGPSALIEDIQSAAEDMKQKQADLVFKKISEMTDRAGRVVDGRGKPFSFELFLEAIKTIDIDFDKDGKPRLPALHVSPILGAKLKIQLPEWEKNQDYKKQFDAVIEEKRKEWDARESNRILAD